jgi:hypothetical protein
VAVWLLVFVTVSKYEPARNPLGNCATASLFVNETRTSGVWANTTLGASPVGLKLVPVMVIRLFEPFMTVP